MKKIILSAALITATVFAASASPNTGGITKEGLAIAASNSIGSFQQDTMKRRNDPRQKRDTMSNRPRTDTSRRQWPDSNRSPRRDSPPTQLLQPIKFKK